VLTQEALNPFVECTSGLIGGEGLSVTLKLGLQGSIEHIQFLQGYRELAKAPSGRKCIKRLRTAIYSRP
jgi:hypothetical protein